MRVKDLSAGSTLSVCGAGLLGGPFSVALSDQYRRRTRGVSRALRNSCPAGTPERSVHTANDRNTQNSSTSADQNLMWSRGVIADPVISGPAGRAGVPPPPPSL
jgi:hypothetical protein